MHASITEKESWNYFLCVDFYKLYPGFQRKHARIRNTRNEFDFNGFYRYVNTGESLTTLHKHLFYERFVGVDTSVKISKNQVHSYNQLQLRKAYGTSGNVSSPL